MTTITSTTTTYNHGAYAFAEKGVDFTPPARKALIAAPVTTTTAQLAALIDLDETFGEQVTTPPTLEVLAERDDVIVDLWSEDETTVVFVSADAAIEAHGDIDSMLEQVGRRLHMGWGREGDLLDGMDVSRHDERTPVEADVTSRTIFRPHVAGRTASWRLIEDAIGEQVAR